MTGIIWDDRPSEPYDLAKVRADNAAWAAKFRPALLRRDEEKREAREAAAKLEAEKEAALAWCHANGNPHLKTPEQSS